MTQYTNWTVEEIEAELAKVDARIEQHNAECQRTSGHALNPAGDIGGIRSRSKRQKRQMWERWDRQAKESIALHQKRDLLAAIIKNRKQAEIEQMATVRVKEQVQVGDLVWGGFPRPVRVKRKNTKSVTVECQSGYTERVPWDRVGIATEKDVKEHGVQ